MIENLVREQYGRSVDLLERGRLIEGVIIPSERDCIELLREQLTDPQISHIQEKIRRPVFQIVPQKPFQDFENALNLNRQADEREAYLTPYIRERFTKLPSNNEVQIGFVEGMPRLPGTSLVQFPFLEQRRLYKKSLLLGVTVIHPRHYSLLQLNGRLDVGYWSYLEDNLENDAYLPGGYSSDQVYFREYNLEGEIHNARWRSAVMVSAN